MRRTIWVFENKPLTPFKNCIMNDFTLWTSWLIFALKKMSIQTTYKTFDSFKRRGYFKVNRKASASFSGGICGRRRQMFSSFQLKNTSCKTYWDSETRSWDRFTPLRRAYAPVCFSLQRFEAYFKEALVYYLYPRLRWLRVSTASFNLGCFCGTHWFVVMTARKVFHWSLNEAMMSLK